MSNFDRSPVTEHPLNIILYTKGSGGDVFPFIRCGQELTRRGHQVTLMTHCVYEARAKNISLDFVALDSPQEYEKFLGDQELLNSPRGIPEFLRRHSLSTASSEYQLVSQTCKDKSSIIVTRDLFDLVPRLVAEQHRLPLRWIFGNPSQVATRSLREWLFSQFLRSEIDKIRLTLGLRPASSENCDFSYPTIGVALWPEWFAESNADSAIRIVPVGFLRDEDTAEEDFPPAIKRILNGGERPVLITAGTGSYIGSEFYEVTAKACELLNFAGIAVMQHSTQQPMDCNHCVSWVGILPFPKLMKHISAVIHHGGLGTLACAMVAGVPQLVLPKGADRPDNAARLQKLGVAEFLPPPNWRPELIAEALMRLVSSPVVAEKCRTAERMSGKDGAEAACQVIEQDVDRPGFYEYVQQTLRDIGAALV
jgi:UDP:flavonoid glycosyltransferase YjiC (YdhE family)